MVFRYELSNPPSVEEYVSGLTAIATRMSDNQRRLLTTQYQVPKRSVTAGELADLADIKGGYPAVNSQYGRLGHMFCDEIGYEPNRREVSSHRWWSVWSSGYPSPEGFVWEMRPEVAEALESLGWVTPAESRLTEEVLSEERFVEGAIRRVTVNAYERNLKARSRCIEHHGTNCVTCNFDFGATYGPLAEGFIHVHHLKPLHEVGEEYEVDSKAHLLPVCPNCHAVIHLGGRTRTIEEVKELRRRADSTS